MLGEFPILRCLLNMVLELLANCTGEFVEFALALERVQINNNVIAFRDCMENLQREIVSLDRREHSRKRGFY